MPSSYSVSGRFTLQGTGENNNTWGPILNNGVFQLVDDSIFGRLGFALSGAKALTRVDGATDEARMAFLDVTGGTGGLITAPPVPKGYFLRNGAAGDVSLKSGAGASALFKPGDAGPCFTDGSIFYNLMLGGLSLRDYITAQVTGSGQLPSPVGNNNKALIVQNLGLGDVWSPGLIGSVNMQAGAAVANIGYTPANKAGDTFSGAVTVNGLVSTVGPAAGFSVGARAGAGSWIIYSADGTALSFFNGGDRFTFTNTGSFNATGQISAASAVSAGTDVVATQGVYVGLGLNFRNGAAAAVYHGVSLGGGAPGAGNSGNDLYFAALDNAGAFIGNAFYIKRSAARLVAINGMSTDVAGSVGAQVVRFNIDGVPRWIWSIANGTGDLTLSNIDGAGNAVARPFVMGLGSNQLVIGAGGTAVGPETFFPRSESGAWLSVAVAQRLTGTGPGIMFNVAGSQFKASLGQFGSTNTLMMTKADGTADKFRFDCDSGTGTAALWTSTSDVRLKSAIAALPSGLDLLAALLPKRFRIGTTEDEAGAGIGRFSTGLVAQDLIGTPFEELLVAPVPDPYGGETFYAFDYSGLWGYAIAAFKEVKTRLDDIEARLTAGGL